MIERALVRKPVAPPHRGHMWQPSRLLIAINRTPSGR